MKKTAKVAIRVIVMTCFFAGFASAGSVMDRILKNGKLVVGITGTQPPLNATAKDGKIIGFDADMANAISANLGVELKLSKMPFAQLLPALQNGKVDMIISGLTMTLERNTTVAGSGQLKLLNKAWFEDGSWIKELP